jgi:sirohydrochlorin ferrochelatase
VTDRPAALLVAHGSADPAAATSTRALAAAVAAARPGWAVDAAYLEHTLPRPPDVLWRLAGTGCPGVVVVPLLLTDAYHGRVDLPAVLARARRAGLRLPVQLGGPLVPVAGAVPAPLVAGLRRRLRQARPAGPGRYDAVVLAAAGTRDPAARATVDAVAGRLSDALGVPCLAGYASAATPTPAGAVTRLRAAGAHRVAVAAYFLARGRLYRSAADGARRAGAVAVAPPLADAPELVSLIVARLDTVSLSRATAPTGSPMLVGTAERPG